VDLGERPLVSRHVLENLGVNDQIECVVVERQLPKILLLNLTSVEFDDGAGRPPRREVLAACQIGELSGKGLVERRELLRDIDGSEAAVTRFSQVANRVIDQPHSIVESASQAYEPFAKVHWRGGWLPPTYGEDRSLLAELAEAVHRPPPRDACLLLRSQPVRGIRHRVERLAVHAPSDWRNSRGRVSQTLPSYARDAIKLEADRG
jgi:hypothetical protein